MSIWYYIETSHYYLRSSPSSSSSSSLPLLFPAVFTAVVISRINFATHHSDPEMSFDNFQLLHIYCVNV